MTPTTSVTAGWFTLSLINAGLAQGKARSGWYRWLLYLVLGPIATFLVVVWSPVTRTGSAAEESTAGR